MRLGTELSFAGVRFTPPKAFGEGVVVDEDAGLGDGFGEGGASSFLVEEEGFLAATAGLEEEDVFVTKGELLLVFSSIGIIDMDGVVGVCRPDLANAASKDDVSVGAGGPAVTPSPAVLMIDESSPTSSHSCPKFWSPIFRHIFFFVPKIFFDLPLDIR